MIVEVRSSTRKGKRFVAVFEDGTRTHFGQAGGSTYLDHRDRIKRQRYQTRHITDLDTHDPRRAGYLSFFLLWGNKTKMPDAIRAYNKMFFA